MRVAGEQEILPKGKEDKRRKQDGCSDDEHQPQEHRDDDLPGFVFAGFEQNLKQIPSSGNGELDRQRLREARGDHQPERGD